MTVREILKKVKLKKDDNLGCLIYYPFGDLSFDVRIIDGNMCIFSPGISEKWVNMILDEEVLSSEYNIERSILKITPALERKLYFIKV